MSIVVSVENPHPRPHPYVFGCLHPRGYVHRALKVTANANDCRDKKRLQSCLIHTGSPMIGKASSIFLQPSLSSASSHKLPRYSLLPRLYQLISENHPVCRVSLVSHISLDGPIILHVKTNPGFWLSAVIFVLTMAVSGLTGHSATTG